MLTLPEFINAQSLEELLAWVPSQRRAFRDEAKRAGLLDGIGDADDIFPRIVDLLRRPHGVWSFEAMVVKADPSKKRGILSALGRMQPAAKPKGCQPGTVAAIKFALLREQTVEAGWHAFCLLSALLADSSATPDKHKDVTELVEAHPALLDMLGVYWSQWQTWSEADDMRTMPEPDTPAQTVETTWLNHVADLRAMLADVTAFDAGLPSKLLAIAESLDELGQRLTEEAGRVAAERHTMARSALEAALRVLAELCDTPEVLALNVEGSEPDIARWESAAQWALDAAQRMSDSIARCEVAARRCADEDSDAADEEDVAAKKQRRALRSIISEEATTWASLLGEPTHESKAVPLPSAVVEAETVAIEEIVAPDPIVEQVGDLAAAEPVETVVDVAPAHNTGVAKVADAMDASVCAEPAAPVAIEPVAVIRNSPEIVPADFAGQPVQPKQEKAPAAEPSNLDVFLASPDLPVTSEEVEQLESAIFTALQMERYGFAAHLASAARALGSHGMGGDAPVLDALAIGTALSAHRAAEAAAAYSQLEQQLYNSGNADLEQPLIRLLLMAGALRPAIFSSHTGAAEIFRMAEPGGLSSALHDLADFLADMPRRGGHLDFADLIPAADAESRRRAADAAREQLLDAVENAGDRRAVYQRATNILNTVLSSGEVEEAVAAIQRKSAQALDKADGAASWLDEDLDRRVELLDDEARRVRRGAPLDGMAKRWL